VVIKKNLYQKNPKKQEKNFKIFHNKPLSVPESGSAILDKLKANQALHKNLLDEFYKKIVF